MGEKLMVGPINSGLKKNREAFVIDNDSFPKLINAFQWRGRVKRKRGTKLIGRLQVIANLVTEPVADGSGSYSQIMTTTILLTFPNAQIAPGNFYFYFDKGGANETLYHDDGLGNVTLVSGPYTITTGSINYVTGRLTLTFSAAPPGGTTAKATFGYYPILPVMGLEDFAFTTNDFPGTVAFDTYFSYLIDTIFPYQIINTNYYENPSSQGGYTAKAAWTPLNWNGNDYQQFWTTNYQGAMWATNGIDTPFTGANIGMQFKHILTVTPVGGPSNKANLEITAHGLVVGDFVFVNEVQTTTGINYQTGYVITVVDANHVIVEFPSATINTNGTGGIAQYLTSSADPTKDCIRYYTGSPVSYTAPNLTFVNNQGWVNFMPPLSQGTFSIGDLPAAKYYLVGARMILPFKDRLLFIGPVVQTSSGLPKYLQDTVIYSQNGTPYYTASFTYTPTATDSDITHADIVFTPSYIVPTDQTASAAAWIEDSTGFGGFVSAGLDQPIITTSSNEDVLIMGFNPSYQVRFVYTGNDILPFNFFIVNSELGSASTFSAVNMDDGCITRGPRGYVMASQVDVARFDLDIPDDVFEIDLTKNGNERFCSQRDFINEWLFFTYPGNTINSSVSKFPNTTLLYNYRDDTWGMFVESYTTYGSFRPTSGLTWATLKKNTWNDWNEPWNSGSTTLLQPQVIAGNQQGFVLERTNDTSEATSLFIQSFLVNTITSPEHGLNEGDYILITGCSGTISSVVNGNVYRVFRVTVDTFQLNTSIDATGLTYRGNGLITRYYIPIIQTKQFPLSWGAGRKTRIGVQQYLLTKTPSSQITLQMYLSQDSSDVWNVGPFVPDIDSVNNSLIYSQILYTCPESTNLGLTPANTNLQQLNELSSDGTSSNGQSQIWHRINTSLIGDTVQFGFTLSDTQMRDERLLNQVAEIELHGFILDVAPSQMLS